MQSAVHPTRFSDWFVAILIDMCGTFRFGHVRVGPSEDFFATYRRLGGRRLNRQQVDDAMQLGLHHPLQVELRRLL